MQKGSLDGALRGIAPPGEGLPKLHWHLRIRLAAACADALSYLHSQPPQVGLFAYMWPFNVSAIWGLHLRQLFDKQICLSKLQAKAILYGRCQCILYDCRSSQLGPLQADRRLNLQCYIRAHKYLRSQKLLLILANSVCQQN